MGVCSGTNFMASRNCLWPDLCLPFTFSMVSLELVISLRSQGQAPGELSGVLGVGFWRHRGGAILTIGDTESNCLYNTEVSLVSVIRGLHHKKWRKVLKESLRSMQPECFEKTVLILLLHSGNAGWLRQQSCASTTKNTFGCCWVECIWLIVALCSSGRYHTYSNIS